MKCRVCDAELSESALMRKGPDGVHLDECDSCYAATQEAIYEDRYRDELRAEVPAEPSIYDVWAGFVRKEGLLEKWAEGLDGPSPLRAMERELDAFATACEFLARGDRLVVAMERACGINRGNITAN